MLLKGGVSARPQTELKQWQGMTVVGGGLVLDGGGLWRRN